MIRDGRKKNESRKVEMQDEVKIVAAI